MLKGLLALTVLVSFISCDSPTNGNTTVFTSGDSIPARLPVAYITTDSLLASYQFVIDKNEEILKKLEDKRLVISRRYEKFRKEVLDYEQRAQRNVYISAERQQQEETRLGREQQDIENAATQVEKEMAADSRDLQISLQDSLDLAIREFNKGKYQIIFSNSGASTFFYMDESYDITKEVIEFLNARYTPARK
jgi:Outer membrane protein